MTRSSDSEDVPKAQSDDILGYLQQKMREGFWGVVEIRFRDGAPTVVTEHRQLKLRSDKKKGS